MSRLVVFSLGLLFIFNNLKVHAQPMQPTLLRAGAIEVIADGQFSPPGDLIKICPIVVDANPVRAMVELRAYKISRVPAGVQLTPLSPNRERIAVVEHIFEPKSKCASIAAPFASLRLADGIQEIVYEIKCLIGGTVQFVQFSEVESLTVGGRRTIFATNSKSIARSRAMEKAYPAKIDGRVEMFTVVEDEEFIENVIESSDRSVEVPGGFGRVAAFADEDRTLATFANKRIVYYATNRRLKEGVSAPRKPEDFADVSSSILRYGSAEAAIPLNHRRGDEVVEPAWFRRRDSAFRFLAFNSLNSTNFYAQVGGQNSADDVLVFVHGFNVPFQSALFKTVQLANDLDYRGKIVTFSWASQGSLFSFRHDLEESKEGAAAFLKFLTALKPVRSGPGKLHILAHSMGSRVVCNALGDANTPSVNFPSIANVVLCAGEIDVDAYESSFEKLITRCGRHSSYYHARDRALTTAKEYHHTQAAPKNPNYLPLGDHPYLRSPPPCTDNIECSGADLEVMATLHGYYSTSIPVLEDLSKLIVRGVPPAGRGLRSRKIAGVEFWSLAP